MMLDSGSQVVHFCETTDGQMLVNAGIMVESQQGDAEMMGLVNDSGG